MLKGLYPDALCSLQYEKDYELLFAVRLSAQCTDARVNQVTPALFARFPTLESLRRRRTRRRWANTSAPAASYNGKARDLVACAQQLLERFGGKVPGTMEELTAPPRRGTEDRQSDPGGRVSASPPMSATPTASASPGGWGITDGSKDPVQVERQLREAIPPAGIRALSATGWCSSAGMSAPPAPLNARIAP